MKIMWSMGTRLTALLAVLLATVLLGAGPAQAQTTTAGLTIDPVATFDAETGIATITGTYACGDASGAGQIEVTLQQQVGRVSTVTGSGFFDITCTPGATGTWSAEVTPTNGEFRGGQARASARLVIEGASVAETGAPVRLSGARRL